MKLLFESANRAEIDGARLLLESKGIPVFVGNEDTARTMSWLFVTREYGLWILVEQQYEDAMALLGNADHEVRVTVNMEEYNRSFEQLHSRNMQKIFNWLMLFLVAMIGVVFVLVAINNTPE